MKVFGDRTSNGLDFVADGRGARTHGVAARRPVEFLPGGLGNRASFACGNAVPAIRSFRCRRPARSHPLRLFLGQPAAPKTAAGVSTLRQKWVQADLLVQPAGSWGRRDFLMPVQPPDAKPKKPLAQGSLVKGHWSRSLVKGLKGNGQGPRDQFPTGSGGWRRRSVWEPSAVHRRGEKECPGCDPTAEARYSQCVHMRSTWTVRPSRST